MRDVALVNIQNELNRIEREIESLAATFGSETVSITEKLNNMTQLDALLNQITSQRTAVETVRAEIAAGRVTIVASSPEETFLNTVDARIETIRERARVRQRFGGQTLERARTIVNNYLTDLSNAERHVQELHNSLEFGLTSIRDISTEISHLVSDYEHLRSRTAEVLAIINTNGADFQRMSINNLEARINDLRNNIVGLKNDHIRNYNSLATAANNRINSLRGRLSGLSPELTSRINALADFSLVSTTVSSYDDNTYRSGMDYARLSTVLEQTRQLENELAGYHDSLNTTLLGNIAGCSTRVAANILRYNDNLPLTEYNDISATNNNELAELTRIETEVGSAGMSLTDADRSELERRITDVRGQIATLEARVTAARTRIQGIIDGFTTRITDIEPRIASNESIDIDSLSMDDLNGMSLNNRQIDEDIETIRTEIISARAVLSTAEYDGFIASLDAYNTRLTAMNGRITDARTRIAGVETTLTNDINNAQTYIDSAEHNFNDSLTLAEINTMIGANTAAITNIEDIIRRVDAARGELSTTQYNDFIRRTNDYRNRINDLGNRLNNAQINRQINDNIDTLLASIAADEALDIGALTPEQISELTERTADYSSDIYDITNNLNAASSSGLTAEQITAIENRLTDATNRLNALTARINGGVRTPDQIHDELNTRFDNIFTRISDNERAYEAAAALIPSTELLPRADAERFANENTSISRDLATIILDLNSHRATLTPEQFEHLNNRAEELRSHLTELTDRISHHLPSVVTPGDTLEASLDNINDTLNDLETNLNDSVTADQLINLSNAVIACENDLMTAHAQLTSTADTLEEARYNELRNRITQYNNRIAALNDRTNLIASRIMPEYQAFFRRIDREKSTVNNLNNLLMSSTLNGGSVSQNMIDLFTSQLESAGRHLETIRQDVERAYADHNISHEQYQNLTRQIDLVNNRITAGNDRIATFNALGTSGFLNLLDGNLDNLEQAITEFENDVNTASTPVVKANKKLLDEKYKRILNKINYLEEELERERENDESNYETKKARLDSLKNRLNTINESYIKKCPLLVKAYRSAKNWFKKHPRIAVIAGGLAIAAATHFLLGPVLYPSIIQGTLMLANKLPLLRPVFLGLTHLAGNLGGATLGEAVVNGVRFNAWTSATGAILNPTVASTSILKGLALTGVGLTGMLAPAVVSLKKLHNKMKKHQTTTNERVPETHTDTSSHRETLTDRLAVTRNLARRELTNEERRNALLASLTPEQRAAIQAELERLAADTEGRGPRR